MTNKSYNYKQVKFITSVLNVHHLPNDYGIEIAFFGRSNAGKSSALNSLTQQKKLAHTSKIPGKIQLINLFEVTKDIRLVDFPGYGYTETFKSIKHQCKHRFSEYLKKRKCLKGLVLLMDIRYPLKNMDIEIIEWSISIKIPILILLTKADKLIFNKQKSQVISVNNKLKTLSYNIQIETFSSLKKIGINKLQLKLNEWINNHYYKTISFSNRWT
ncbi:MAG: ribosome biogenesis GTP-binding protein YihA/YsxC [Arsenophonus sp. ET-YP4-MAG3]